MNNLQPSTQKEYRRILTAIEAKFGCAPIAAIADPRFVSDALEWRDEIAVSKPREADNRMIVLGRLLSWAKKRHRISANVLEGYERIYRTDRSEKIWLPEHIAVMERVASPEFLSLFLGALFTGLRQGDLRKLPWSAYDGKAITWRVTKRRKGDAGVKLTIPCLTVLRSLLDSLPRRGPLIFTTATGGAWQKRYVARHFETARAEAAKALPEVADLHFHDTRGTAITMLAEAGASVPEIAAITGHSYRTINSILEKYLPRTRHLAEMAIAKLENSGRTDFANRLQTGSSKKKKGEPK
jgi:integrase